MRQAFTQPGFRRLFGGLSASMLGDSLMLLVLSMWVKTLTGSNSMAGLTFFFMVIPALGAPYLGVLIDRVRRKPLLVWGNVASAVAVMPLLLVRDAGDVWLIWLVAFAYGVSFIVLPAALGLGRGRGGALDPAGDLPRDRIPTRRTARLANDLPDQGSGHPRCCRACRVLAARPVARLDASQRCASHRFHHSP